MIPLLYLIGLTMVAGGIGKRVLDLLRIPTSGSSLETLVMSVGTGYGLLAYVMFSFGIAGWLYRPVVQIALVGVGLVGWPSLRGLDISGAWREVRRFSPGGRLHRYMGWLLLSSMAFNFVGTLAPVSSADALAIHFAAPKIWLQSHRITEIPFHWETFAGLVVQMLYLLGMVISSDVLGAELHWLFGVLIALGLIVFCRQRVARVDPLIPATIVYVTGLMAWESTSGFVDLGLAFFSLLAISAFCHWMDNGDDAWLRASGVFAGFAAATKYHGAVVAGLLGVLLFVPIGFSSSEPLRKRLHRLTMFAVPLLCVVSPWYARNLLHTGDPLYPFLSAWQGAPNAQHFLAETAGASGYGKTLSDLLALPFRLAFRGEGFGQSQLLGPVYLSFLPLGILFLSRESPVLRVVWLLVVTYSFIWFLTCQQVRFLLPVVPLAAVACASMIQHLQERGASIRIATRATLAAALTSGFLITGVYNARLIPVVVGLESKDSFLSRTTWFYDDIEWMNQFLPGDARVLFLARAGYYLDRNYIKGDDGVTILDPTDREFSEWLSRYRITHIYCTGASCEKLLSSGQPLTLLRESTADRVGSRTLGGSRGRVRTALFARL